MTDFKPVTNLEKDESTLELQLIASRTFMGAFLDIAVDGEEKKMFSLKQPSFKKLFHVLNCSLEVERK